MRHDQIAAVATFAVALAGCSTFGAASGNTSDCASAEQQLATARTALVFAQIAVTNAEAIGGPAVALAQTAVNTIQADVTAIQSLVASSCTVATAPPPGVPAPVAERAPTITLDQAKHLAATDKALAAALKAR